MVFLRSCFDEFVKVVPRRDDIDCIADQVMLRWHQDRLCKFPQCVPDYNFIYNEICSWNSLFQLMLLLLTHSWHY